MPYEDYKDIVDQAAQDYEIPLDLFIALIQRESGFDPTAQSPAGARGLMQLMPETEKALGVNALIPKQAVPVGAKYLRQHYDEFGEWPLALAAYNAGPSAVRKHKGIPPYKETQEYVDYIMTRSNPNALKADPKDRKRSLTSDQLIDQMFDESTISASDALIEQMFKPEPEKPSVEGVKKGILAEEDIARHKRVMDKVGEYKEGIGIPVQGFMGGTIGAKKALGYESPSEVDEYQLGPLLSDEQKGGILKSVSAIGNMLKDPYSMAAGAVDFISQVVSFPYAAAIGVGKAADFLGKRFLMDKSWNLNDLADAFEGGMEEGNKNWLQFFNIPAFVEAQRTGLRSLVGMPISEKEREQIEANKRTMGEVLGVPGEAVYKTMEMLSGVEMEKLAESEVYKDWPNARGAMRILSFPLVLAAFRKVYGGGHKKFVEDVKPIAEKAKVIAEAQKAVDIETDPGLKDTAQKVLDFQKAQLEREAAALMEKVDFGEWIKEDFRGKGEKSAHVKMMITNAEKEALRQKGYTDEQISNMKPQEAAAILSKPYEPPKVRQAKKYIADEAINEAIERIKEPKKVVEIKPKTKVVEEKPIEETFPQMFGMSPENIAELAKDFTSVGKLEEFIDGLFNKRAKFEKESERLWPEESDFVGKEGKDIFYKSNALLDLMDKYADEDLLDVFSKTELARLRKIQEKRGPKRPKVEAVPEEPVTDVDLLTGRKLPQLYDTQSSPFFDSAERTEFLKNEFTKGKWKGNLELTTQKLINDVNRWVRGDDSINIEETRNQLSTFASHADELMHNFEENIQYFHDWKDTVSDAATWARNAERSPTLREKIEQRGVDEPIEDIAPTDTDRWSDQAVKEDLARIDALEKYYEKPIEEITDAEVEDFYTKPSGVDWFGEDLSSGVDPRLVVRHAVDFLNKLRGEYRHGPERTPMFDGLIMSERMLPGDPVKGETVKGAKAKEMKPIKTQFRLDKTNLLPVLLKDICNQDPNRTMIYELMQNSLDAFIDPKKGKIRIDIEDMKAEDVTGQAERTGETRLVFSDNGFGMSPKDVKAFFLVAGSIGKTGTTTRGGYGLASVGITLIPKRIIIESTKNGVTSRVDTTREAVFSGDIFIKPEKTGNPPGTTVTAYFSDKMYNYYMDSYSLQNAVAEVMKSTWTEADVKVRRRRAFEKDFTDVEFVRRSRIEDSPKVEEKDSFTMEGSKVDIHYIKTDPYGWEDSNGFTPIEATVTNKGLVVDVRTDRDLPLGKTAGKPDFRVVVDFVETPTVRDPMYPFLKNRTEITENIRKKIIELAKEKVDRIRGKLVLKKGTDFKDMVESSREILPGIRILNPLKGEAREAAEAILDKHIDIFRSFSRSMEIFKRTLEDVGETGVDYHLTIDPAVYGFKSKPELTGYDIYAINPIAISGKMAEQSGFKEALKRGISQRRLQADTMTHALVHEYGHKKEFNHTERFTIELARLVHLIGHEKLNEINNVLRRFYDEHGEKLDGVGGSLQGIFDGRNGLGDYNSSLVGSEYAQRYTSDLRKVAREKREGKGTKLEIGIPVQGIPKAVLDALKGAGLTAKEAFRNEDIWRRTGWWLGKDLKWRYEVDTDKLRLKYEHLGKYKYQGKLQDVLEFEEIYNKFPWLKKVNLILKCDPDATPRGAYNRWRNEIRIDYGDTFQLTDLLAHEVQHAIQHRVLGAFKGTSTTAEASKLGVDTDDIVAWGAYRGTPGEIEARLATKRAMMTQAQRAQEPPWVTLEKMLAEEYPEWPGAVETLGREVYSGVPLGKSWKEIRDMQSDLRDKVTKWITGASKEKPKLEAVYRGVPKNRKEDRAPGEYTHVSPWPYVAGKGGKGGFGDPSNFEVLRYPVTEDMMFYRGGSLAGDPLERTRIHNAQGMSWDDLLSEARGLYESEVVRAKSRARREGVEFHETDKKRIAEEVVDDLVRASFEADERNLPGIWRGQTVPYEMDKDFPKLRSNDYLKEIIDLRRKQGYTEEEIAKMPEARILTGAGKIYSGVPAKETYEQVTKLLGSLKNVVSRKGRVSYGKGPHHGTDIDYLESILDSGLKAGSAIDTGIDWAGEYPVVVSVPGAKLGKYIEHNKYYTSAESAMPTRVVVDLEQYHGRVENDIRSTIARLASKHPEVSFVILNESGPYKPKYSVEQLTQMYDDVTKLYGERDPSIDEHRATIETIRNRFRIPNGIIRNISAEAREEIGRLEAKIKQLEKDHDRKIKIAESRIREAEKDIEFEYGKGSLGLSSGVSLEEIVRQVTKGAEDFSRYCRESRAATRFRPRDAVSRLRAEFNRKWIDRSGNIRIDLLDTLGDDGMRVVQGAVLSKGAGALSEKNLRQMQKEVHGGLDNRLKNVLFNMILARRMIDIGSYKKKGEFFFPKDVTPEKSIMYLDRVKDVERLTTEEAKDLSRRMGIYFEWMRKPLKEMLKSGILSQEEYNRLASHNYRRIELNDISRAYDKSHSVTLGGKRRVVYDSGVQRLARGRDTDVYELNADIMALEVFNRSYGRILNNEANKELLKLAREKPDNPFVWVKKERGDKKPPEWKTTFVYENGKRIPIHLEPEFAKEWISSSPEMTYGMSQFIRWASGSVILRTFATGIEWGFALANLPRDILHSWYAARKFEDGQWKSLYSTLLPRFAYQMGRDQLAVFHDALRRGDRFNEYLEDGGGMELLVHQGRVLQKGRRLEGPVDKFYDFMGYLGETSEIMTRLAIRERVMRDRARKLGISLEEARKNPDIRKEASFAARDYFDFGQGGGWAKGMDNALPYLNAAIQATRGIGRAFRDNPAISSWKLIQLSMLTTGVYLAARKNSPETMRALEGSNDSRNNLILPFPDSFGFEDENGDMRYPYLKLPLDQFQRFFKKFFEAATDKYLGNQIDVDGVVKTLQEFSPVGVTEMPPAMSAFVGYVSNKDFWLNEDIWRGTDKPLPYPLSQYEYRTDTPSVYRDLGAITGLSPERTKYAFEEMFTSNSMWTYLVGKVYEDTLGDLPKRKKVQHWARSLAETPGLRRFIGITNPYSKHATSVERYKTEDDLKYYMENIVLESKAEEYIDGRGTVEDIFKYIGTFPDKDTRDRLKDKFDFMDKTKSLPERSFWWRLKGLKPTARARAWLHEQKYGSEAEKAAIRKGLPIVADVGGVLTKEFWNEVEKYRRDFEEPMLR